MKTGGRKSRGFESHPLRHALALAIIAGALVAGCSAFARSFVFSFPAEGTMAELPVVLRDETGVVVSMGAAPANLAPILDAGMLTVPGSPNAIIVHWTGGACDDRVELTASGSSDLTLTLQTINGPGGCDAVGVPRAVLILLGRPVDMSRTSLRIQ